VNAAEGVMGQFIYALGAGAQVWIHRDAIEWFRDLFLPDITTMVALPDWEAIWSRESRPVLQLCRLIGYKAAGIAADKNHISIGLRSLDTAVTSVMGGITKGAPGAVKMRVHGAPCSTEPARRAGMVIPPGASD
jgi:hypothetical protein